MAASDEELVSRFRAGDDLAFVRLYNRYKRPLLGFCLSFLPHAAAEDVVQETFLRLFKRRARLDPGSFRATLFVTARNLCLNALRGRNRVESMGNEEPQIGETENPDRAVEARDLLSRLTRGLTREERELLLLRELGGLSYEDLATLLAKSPGALRVQMFRIRQKLHSALRRLESEEKQR